MKKLFLSVLMLSLATVAMAQNNTSKEARAAQRAARQEQMTQQLTSALQNHNFTFSASQVSTPIGGMPQTLNQWNNYVEVYPESIQVSLPYITGSVDLAPLRIEFTTTQFTFWEDMNNGSQWTVVFQTETGANVKYVFHLNYDTNSGLATLTLVPNSGNTLTYTGSLQAN